MTCGTLWAQQPFPATYSEFMSSTSSTRLCTRSPAEFANWAWPGRHLPVYWCAQLSFLCLFSFLRGSLSSHYFGSFSQPSQQSLSIWYSTAFPNPISTIFSSPFEFDLWYFSLWPSIWSRKWALLDLRFVHLLWLYLLRRVFLPIAH